LSHNAQAAENLGSTAKAQAIPLFLRRIVLHSEKKNMLFSRKAKKPVSITTKEKGFP